MAIDSPVRVIYFTHNLSSTCGPGCRCVRQWTVFDSVEADFRRMREETLGYEADELVLERSQHGFAPVRINRAGRCLTDWNVKIKEEKAWLHNYKLAVEEGKRVAREQEEAEEKEREAERERRKAHFVSSFGSLKWL